MDLSKCVLGDLPTNTFSVERNNDVLWQLLELLPLSYTSKTSIEQRIPEDLLLRIIYEARNIIAAEPFLVSVDSPVHVCGDLHGQYYDLLNIFHKYPPFNGATIKEEGKLEEALKDRLTYKFLFLGDYVDRGVRSIEVVITLLCLKLISPSHVYMLRGNHEDEKVTLLYGFFDECKRRYGVRLFKAFTDLFRVLPAAALVNDSIFCMHGGISSSLPNILQLQDTRPCEVPNFGVLCDLVWADPEINLPDDVDWAPSPRRVSSVFSERALERFLRDNDLDLVCRAHQVVEEGFLFFPSNQKRLLLTVFSATNYCNEFGNRGGMLSVNADGVCSVIALDPPNFIQQRDIMLFKDPLPNPSPNS